MPSRAVHALAWVTCGSTWILIVAGGLVTNTGAALAVPDWPTTFGHNMFLFPWSGMVGGVLFEHGHRLLGALVGLLTLTLAATMWGARQPAWLRGLGALAVVLVVIQGLLGGLRVVLLQEALAMVHGVLAQGFFAVTAIIVAGTAASRQPAPESAAASADHGTGSSAAERGLPLALATALVVYGQITLGALATHAGWINLHVAGAAVALGAVAVLVARLRGRDVEGGLVGAIGAVTALQLVLGLGAWAVRFTGVALPGGSAIVVLLPVAHRAVGALLLALLVTLAFRAWRGSGDTRASGHASTPHRVLGAAGTRATA